MESTSDLLLSQRTQPLALSSQEFGKRVVSCAFSALRIGKIHRGIRNYESLINQRNKVEKGVIVEA